MKTNFNELAQDIHVNAKQKGFYDTEKNIGEMLCLIHSEVSEALEADRKNHYTTTSIKVVNGWVPNGSFESNFKAKVKNTFEDELSDIIIRVLDLCAFKKIDIDSHIKAKMRYNSLREKMHGKKY